jgi:hypothetical protein
VNAGRFGSHICLVEYPLWIETREMRHYKQVYRLFNLEAAENRTLALSSRLALSDQGLPNFSALMRGPACASVNATSFRGMRRMLNRRGRFTPEDEKSPGSSPHSTCVMAP